MSEQIDLVKDIARRLDSAAIEYMFTGSIAMVFYATPRMTRDIDLVVRLLPADAQKLIDLFAADCYIDPTSVRRAIAHAGTFNIISNELILKADFIVRKNDEFRLLEFSRRQSVELDDCRIFLVTPEDLILSKLLWGKDSDSELQLRDVRNLLASVPDLDRGYLIEWAGRLGASTYLKKAMTNE
jgi:hypothetical protein